MNNMLIIGAVMFPTLAETFTLEDIASMLTFFSVLVGGIFALVQWNKNLKLKRADYLNELVLKLRTDPILKKATTYFDYNDPWYTEDFHNSDIEKEIDYILTFFSYICYLKKSNIIEDEEFKMFEYEITRIIKSNQTKEYFDFINHFSELNNTTCSFAYLIEYAEDMKKKQHRHQHN